MGQLGSLKAITSNSVSSECILKYHLDGLIQLVNTNETQLLSGFPAHFVSNADDERACNFALFLPAAENTPIQVIAFLQHLLRISIVNIFPLITFLVLRLGGTYQLVMNITCIQASNPH